MQEQLVGFVYEKSHLFDIPVFLWKGEENSNAQDSKLAILLSLALSTTSDNIL